MAAYIVRFVMLAARMYASYAVKIYYIHTYIDTIYRYISLNARMLG